MTDKLSAHDLEAFDFELPPERIAQEPAQRRDAARLFRLPRREGPASHHLVSDLAELLQPGDLLVLNATRVLPARLRGRKETGGQAEALLLGPWEAPSSSAAESSHIAEAQHYRALVRCGGRMREGQRFVFEREENGRLRQLQANLIERLPDGEVVLGFASGDSPYGLGEMPLPPYIRREQAQPMDERRYQTVFAREEGSVAAPTAGLHFTDALFERLDETGIERAEVILHVGPGTFRPIAAEQLAAGKLHSERYELPEATASAVQRTRARGGRVIAVGTTSTRVLESCADEQGQVQARSGETDIFIHPGVPFRVVDGLLTNFHLPKSSLLLLVAAFAGRERILDAYAEALREEYRFFSYGDAMLIL